MVERCSVARGWLRLGVKSGRLRKPANQVFPQVGNFENYFKKIAISVGRRECQLLAE
jgi:hypothetical protein